MYLVNTLQKTSNKIESIDIRNYYFVYRFFTFAHRSPLPKVPAVLMFLFN